MHFDGRNFAHLVCGRNSEPSSTHRSQTWRVLVQYSPSTKTISDGQGPLGTGFEEAVGFVLGADAVATAAGSGGGGGAVGGSSRAAGVVGGSSVV